MPLGTDGFAICLVCNLVMLEKTGKLNFSAKLQFFLQFLAAYFHFFMTNF
jgi:hypothetical protein